MGITKKGLFWELRNSLWVLWAIFPMLNSIGFFWIGSRARQKKWTISGGVYALVSVIIIVLIETVEKGNILYDIAMILFFVVWIVPIVHSLKIRKEYLLHREIVVSMGADEQELREKVRQAHNIEEFPVKTTPLLSEEKKEVEERPIREKVDINFCSAEDLAQLPGMNLISAKRAVQLREENNGFLSVDDFLEKLDIKPHFTDKIKQSVTVSPMDEKPKANARVLDI